MNNASTLIGAKERFRTVMIFSGGLDSRLAVCVLRDQGIDVHAVVFDSPFFNKTSAIAGAEQIGIPLRISDFSADIIGLVNNPQHGLGSGMNPCKDCHARMLKRAGDMMEELHCHFITSGEVLGQRPMSQTLPGLELVARESGYDGLIVRPLSAKLLPETRAEQEGWVDRSRLLDISGRSREVQLKLAEQYGLTDFPSPAGGCRLTDPNFAARLRDLQSHEGLNGVRSINLLRVGRHFRLANKVKLIVGRHEQDNVDLEGNAELYDLVLKVEDIPSPTALLPATAREDEVKEAAAICARYSDCDHDQSVVVRIRSARGTRKIEVLPAKDERVQALRV